MARLTTAALSLAVASSVISPAVLAEDFRIETKVYVGDEEKPVQETLTIFVGNVVYDIVSTAPVEISIYDSRLDYFTLLDVERKVQTRIDRKVLAEFVARVKVAAQRGGAIVREAASPDFESSFDERLDEVTLDGQYIRYKAQGEKIDSESARQYFQFADMFARLNATRPGSLPPFARLELNRVLSQQKLMPTKVERTLKSSNPLARGGMVARSEHAFAKRILVSDRQEINKVDRYLQQFQQVTFHEYRQLDRFSRGATAGNTE